MTLPSFATQTITVQRPGTTTDHGTTVADWATPTEHDITGCSVQPGTGPEQASSSRDTVETLFTVYAPDGADVTSGDRVLWDGSVFDVDGSVQQWQTGVLDHVTFTMRKVAG